MFNLKLVVAYEGTHYLGWQKTKEGPSIEEALEKALAQLLQHEVALQAASRTDAGVHAEGQVVNFCTEKEVDPARLLRGVRGLLPSDISVRSSEMAAPSFHPTLDAQGKQYDYHLCLGPVQLPFHRHTSWHFPQPLDIEKMRVGAESLIGTHDFSAFCNERSLLKGDAVRTISGIEISLLPGSRLRLSIKGNHFLYKMARNIVGTLVYVGAGKLPPEELSHILESQERPRAGVTAPAHGLCLKEVFYQ